MHNEKKGASFSCELSFGPGCIPCKRHTEVTPSSSKCYAKRMKGGSGGIKFCKPLECILSDFCLDFLIKYTVPSTSLHQRLYNCTPVHQAFLKSTPKIFSVTYIKCNLAFGRLLFCDKALVRMMSIIHYRLTFGNRLPFIPLASWHSLNKAILLHQWKLILQCLPPFLHNFPAWPCTGRACIF